MKSFFCKVIYLNCLFFILASCVSNSVPEQSESTNIPIASSDTSPTKGNLIETKGIITQKNNCIIGDFITDDCLVDFRNKQLILLFCDSVKGGFTVYASKNDAQYSVFEFVDTLPKPDELSKQFKIRNKETGTIGTLKHTIACGAYVKINCGSEFYEGMNNHRINLNPTDILKNKLSFDEVYFDQLPGEYIEENTGERLIFAKEGGQWKITYANPKNKRQALNIVPQTHFQVFFDNNHKQIYHLTFDNSYSNVQNIICKAPDGQIQHLIRKIQSEIN